MDHKDKDADFSMVKNIYGPASLALLVIFLMTVIGPVVGVLTVSLWSTIILIGHKTRQSDRTTTRLDAETRQLLLKGVLPTHKDFYTYMNTRLFKLRPLCGTREIDNFVQLDDIMVQYLRLAYCYASFPRSPKSTTDAIHAEILRIEMKANESKSESDSQVYMQAIRNLGKALPRIDQWVARESLVASQITLLGILFEDLYSGSIHDSIEAALLIDEMTGGLDEEVWRQIEALEEETYEFVTSETHHEIETTR